MIKQFKVVLIGDTQSGKTSILKRFDEGTFDKDQVITLGASFKQKLIELSYNNTKIKLHVWDTAGKEIFKSLTHIYFQDAAAGLCVIDQASKLALQNAQFWIKDFRDNAPSSSILGIVLNKSDLNGEVTLQECKDFVLAHQLDFFQVTSAKDNIGISELFQKVAIKIDFNNKSKAIINNNQHNQIPNFHSEIIDEDQSSQVHNNLQADSEDDESSSSTEESEIDDTQQIQKGNHFIESAQIQEQAPVELIAQKSKEQNYAKNKWIKIQYNHRIKRVFEPPTNLYELINILKTRFKDLNSDLNDYSKFDNGLKLKDLQNDTEAMNLMKYINVAYKDSDDDDNEIHETIDLIDAYKYSVKRESKKVLKFQVSLEPIRQSQVQMQNAAFNVDQHIPDQQILHNFVQEVEEEKQGIIPNLANDIQNDEKYFNQELEYRFTEGINNSSSIFNKSNFDYPQFQEQQQNQSTFSQLYQQIEAQFEDKQDDNHKFNHQSMIDLMNDNSSSQEEIDKIISSLQGRMSVRPDELQKQKEILEQIEAYKQQKFQVHQDEELARNLNFQEQYKNGGAGIGVQQQQQYSGGMNYQNQRPSQQQQQQTFYGGQQPQPIPSVMYKPQKKYNLDAALEMVKLDEKKAQPLNAQQNKKQNALGKWWKDNFGDNKPDKLPETRMKMAVAINGHQSYVKKSSNSLQVTLQWDINNQSAFKWEPKTILRNHYLNDVTLNPIQVKKALKSGRLYRFKLTVKIPKDITLDQIFLRLRFENQKQEQFGDFLVGIIDLSKHGIIPREADFFDGDVSRSNINSLASNQSFAQQQQHKPSKVSVQDTDTMYMIASSMSDEGHGDFDTCLEILKFCNGDKVEAIRVLQGKQ